MPDMYDAGSKPTILYTYQEKMRLATPPPPRVSRVYLQFHFLSLPTNLILDLPGILYKSK